MGPPKSKFLVQVNVYMNVVRRLCALDFRLAASFIIFVFTTSQLWGKAGFSLRIFVMLR